VKARTAALAALCTLAAASTASADFVPEAGSPYTTGADPYGIVAGDVNGDGRPDAAVVNGTSSNVSVFLRQAAGGFAQEAGSPFAVGAGPNLAALADFNGDGRLDLAVSSYNSPGVVTVLLRQAGGGYALETPVTDGGGQLTAIATANFNNDSLPDLAVTRSSGQVAVLLRSPGGGFSVEGGHLVGANPADVAVGDFNGDGRPDLAVTNAAGAVSILLRNGLGTAFVPEEGSISVGPDATGIAAADLDGSGGDDLAVTSYGGNTVSVLLRNAGAGFTAEGSPIPVPGGPLGVAAGDFDGDGRNDLAVASNAAGAVTILRRQPAGAFAAVQSITVPRAYRIAVADFDGDARRDLAVSADTNPGSMHVFVSPGQQPPPPAPTPTPTATPLPEPVAGRAVNALPKSGTVKVRRPGSKRFTTLREGEQIPVGTTVDTRKGRVTIIAAAGAGKPPARSDFFGGLFKLSQARAKVPTTTLTLTEALACSKKTARASASKPKKRRLWGDGKGRFRTKGRYAAATVRGTRWLVEDRCGSTLTRVTTGVVAVRDQAKRKTVLVRKGGRYIARGKR
jgi:hypothetical protein